MFSQEIAFRKITPEQRIRQLRAEGLSLAKVAKQAETTPAVVRRVVGKLDPQVEEARRKAQMEVARRIDAQPLPWSEKAKLWTEETGQSGTTFWRVLKGCPARTSP
jgi:hypothetical protein